MVQVRDILSAVCTCESANAKCYYRELKIIEAQLEVIGTDFDPPVELGTIADFKELVEYQEPSRSLLEDGSLDVPSRSFDWSPFVECLRKLQANLQPGETTKFLGEGVSVPSDLLLGEQD